MCRNKSKLWSLSLKATFIFVFIPCCFSAPVENENDSTLYSIFVADMTRNNCTLPSQIPVSFGAKETTLEASLQICNMPEYLRFNKEVKVICSEIFGLLKNISCSPQNAVLPSIHIPLSADVCKDFAVYSAVLPKGLLKHLSDSFDCKLMCADDIEESCKVLLWSFLVQSQIKESEGVETVKTTKTSSVTAAKPESKFQENPETAKTNDGQSPDNLDDTTIKVVKISTPNELSNTLNSKNELSNTLSSKEAKTAPGYAQEMASVEPEIPEPNGNPDALNPQEPQNVVQGELTESDVTEPSVQSNPLNNKEVESENAENELKIKNIIPIKTTFKVPANQDQTNVDGDLKNKIPSSQVPVEPKDQTTPNNKAKTELQPKSTLTPKELYPEISNKAMEEDLREEDTKKSETLKSETLKSETVVSDNKVESKNTVSDSNAESMKPSEADQKTGVSETKVDDSDVSLVGKSPTPPSEEATPAADATPVAVSGSMSESISNPSSVASVVIPTLEKMEDDIPLPNDKDSDQYNLDNGDEDLDREYSKQEYGDAGMYEPTKNKESISETPKSVIVSKEPVIPQNDDTKVFNELPPRDSFGRSSEEIQVLAAFPEQEDSHFFFYFLSLVLILMAGYLIFHNKQKIIALIVEGRHERRRRSHGLGYKKLETK